MGERHDTDLVRLAEEAGEKLYPAHRIDKVTSGVLLLAKDLALHGDLTRQFNRRTVDKVYLAITATTGLPGRGTIELPLSVGRKNRVRVAANRAAIAFDPACSRWSIPADEQFQDVRSYPSTTTFQAVSGDAGHTLLAVCPLTGRRHQIRVHLAWIGHPIEGDPLFDKAADRPDACCTHGGWGSTRPGTAAGASGSRRPRNPTSGRRCPGGPSRCPAGRPLTRCEPIRWRGEARRRRVLAEPANGGGSRGSSPRDSRASGRRRAEEDAEGMPGRVGVDAQRLLRVARPVVESSGPPGPAPAGGPRRVRPRWSRTGPDASAGVPRRLATSPRGSSATCWNAIRAAPAASLRTSQSWPAGSGSPGAGGSSPGRYCQPSSCR